MVTIREHLTRRACSRTHYQSAAAEIPAEPVTRMLSVSFLKNRPQSLGLKVLMRTDDGNLEPLVPLKVKTADTLRVARTRRGQGQTNEHQML